MSHPQRVRSTSLFRCVGALGAFLLVMLFVVSGTALAEEPKGFGELARFAEKGDSPGQLDETRTHAIGVDPTDNSVYAVDEAVAPEVAGGKITRHFRLQKFTESGGKYAVSASASFEESSPFYEGVVNEPTIEGIAVDTTAKKVYLLALDIREKTLAQDREDSSGVNLLAASTLYAFSTQESKGELVAAGGGGTPVLTGPAALGAQSETPGTALLAPRGLTVDSSTGEIIILGHVDPVKRAADETSLAGDHYALQRIKSDGSVVGAKYIDKTDVLKKELGKAFKPTSPIVVEAGGKRRLELAYGGIMEIPAEGAPKRLSLGPEEGIAQGPTDELGQGGRLTASPDGTVWGATGSINNETGPEVVTLAGLMGFSGEGSPVGWTGGQVPVEPARTSDKCVLEPYVLGNNAYLQHVAAGSGGKVFALAPEFLLRQEEFENEKEEIEFLPLPGPFFPAIIEFGPGGGGCPDASATTPVAKNGEIEIKGEEPVSPGAELTLSTHVKQADALKVDWDFGDGKPVTVTSTSHFQDPRIKHKFETEGPVTVKATIYSDNLATGSQVVYKEGHLTTPTIKVERKLLISRPHPKPEFSISPAPAGVAQTVTFKGEASDANGAGALPLEYAWDFGDGAKTSGQTTATHAYAAAGTYTITLTVTDKLGLKGSISHLLTVTAPGGGGGGEEGGGAGSTGGNTGIANTPGGGSGPGPGPGSGVLSYQASLAGAALSVSRTGTVALTVKCLGQSSCTGSVTLRTLKAVSARASASSRKRILALGSGQFSIPGGTVKKVTIRLTAQARRLLARLHVLPARATMLARDSQGTQHTNFATVTLRPAKGKHH